MFKYLRADADLTQQQELRKMVPKSLSRLETFGSVSEQNCFKVSLSKLPDDLVGEQVANHI